jgi:hypothetical protein
MKSTTFWDAVRSNLSAVYEWISRMFLTCSGNRCSCFYDPVFIADDEGLFPLKILIDGDAELIFYVYFCPWCGRRLKKEREL